MALTGRVELAVPTFEHADVPRAPRIPSDLSDGPFALRRALTAGLTKRQLRGSAWKRLGPEVYVRRRQGDEMMLRLKAASLRLPDGAAFSGPTAALLQGLDSRCDVIEATIPSPTCISRRAGVKIRRRKLAATEVVIRKGLPVTSPLRTLVDLTSRLSLVEAVVYWT